MPNIVVRNALRNTVSAPLSGGSVVENSPNTSLGNSTILSDTMSSPYAMSQKNAKIDSALNKLQRPNSTVAPQTFQVVGANPTKTVFSKAEFVNLQKTLCPEGQPLVLVQEKSTSGSVERFILGTNLMDRVEDDEITEDHLKNFNAYLFHGGMTAKPTAVPLACLMGNGDELSLVDALLSVNSPHQDTSEVYARQCLIAAMLFSSVFGFDDAKLAADLVQKVPERYRKSALDRALFSCAGQERPTLAQRLLDWGANPNAQQVDDELSVLGVAIRHFNEPLIHTLLAYGADPLTETGTDISAVELVKTEPYKKLLPLFEKYATAP